MVKICGNCVYAKICKKAVGSWFSPKNIAYCEAYKDSTNYVEVVRCKDCKHLVLTEEGEHNPDDCVCDYWMTDGLNDDDFCSYGERTEKPQTNADRIRAMSDEELAKVPAKFGYSCVFPQKECSESDTCEKCLLEWLKQPAEGENNVGKSKTEFEEKNA